MCPGCSSYADSSVVEWDVQSPSLMDFIFPSFDTEACCDVVEVIDGTLNDVLGTYRGQALPPPFRSRHLRFRFSSDETLTYLGFQVNHYPPKEYSFCFGAYNFTLGASGRFGCDGSASGATIEWLYPPGPDRAHRNLVVF